MTIACGLVWIVGEANLLPRVLNITLKNSLDVLTGVVLAFGAMVTVTCLHVLQRGRYGWRGTIFFLIGFVGLLLAFNGGIRNFFQTILDRDGPLVLQYLSLDIYMDEFSLLIASIGILGLGVLTIVDRVLPWWCGVALIAGSPIALVVEYLLVESLVWTLLPSTRYGPPGLMNALPWVLLAVPWIVVGYAIFRAKSYLPEQPLRVR